jgi:hypothetical protein
MVVHPSVPAKTLPEFIAYAKANPGKLSYGSGGVGGITHITAEQFKQEAGGLDTVHVPYRGVAPALTDLLGGQIQVTEKSGRSPILTQSSVERPSRHRYPKKHGCCGPIGGIVTVKPSKRSSRGPGTRARLAENVAFAAPHASFFPLHRPV